MRYVVASTRLGPPPLRALSTAERVAAYTAITSLPSTSTPSKPYPAARSAKLRVAVCTRRDVEIAHWLLDRKKTIGAFVTPARLRPSWKSPSDEPPSPMYVMTTESSPRSFKPHASPVACGSCAAIATCVGRTLTPSGMRRADLAQVLRGDDLERQPMVHAGHQLAVLRHHPVARRVDSHGRADDRRLLAHARRVDAELALPLQPDDPVVIEPRLHHPAQRLEEELLLHRLRAVDQLPVGLEHLALQGHGPILAHDRSRAHNEARCTWAAALSPLSAAPS